MAQKKKKGGSFVWLPPDCTQIVKTNKDFLHNYQTAMSYLQMEISADQLEKEVVKYLKNKDPKHPLLEKVKNIHENRFAGIGKYIYIVNRGGEIPEDVLPDVGARLEKIIIEEDAKIVKDVDVEKEAKSTISIQERILSRTREIAGEIEGWLDVFCVKKSSKVKTVEDFVGLFKSTELKAPHLKYMREIFENRAKEIEDAIEGKEKDLVEAYSNFKKNELKELGQFYTNLLTACGMLQSAAKVERAPRKKKPVSFEKLVSKLKYKKEDNSLGIVSLNPVQLVGAREVWIYNTKTRKLAQYKSDIQGLSVKGASLLNFTADSVEKMLRKPQETLADFKKANKVKLRTFLKDLSTVEAQCNGKINEHCVILRIDS